MIKSHEHGATICVGARVVARYHNEGVPIPGRVVSWHRPCGYWIVKCDDGKRRAFAWSELEREKQA